MAIQIVVFDYINDTDRVPHKREMKLNGKSKKASKYEAKPTYKRTNKAGYDVVSKSAGQNKNGWPMAKYYLKTPKDKIYLEYYAEAF